MRYNLETNKAKWHEINKTQMVMEICLIADNRRRPKDGDYGFAILEPEQPVNGCAYVQMACNNGEEELSIEARFLEGDDFQHFHKDTTDLEWLISVFDRFMDGEVPDTSDWEDWTEEF